MVRQHTFYCPACDVSTTIGSSLDPSELTLLCLECHEPMELMTPLDHIFGPRMGPGKY